MSAPTTGLVGTIMSLPIFQAEWVLYLLIVLSIATFAVMIERVAFYRRHRIDIDSLRTAFSERLNADDVEGAVALLRQHDSLETNVVLFGLRDFHSGPDAVEDLIAAAARKEKSRYERRLSFLATVASNAPFIGLFGTVLGIIRAFQDLSGNMGDASSAVMAGIAEALIATAVGLLVAIPAVVAFNIFKGTVKSVVDDMHLLAGTLTAKLKSADTSATGA